MWAPFSPSIRLPHGCDIADRLDLAGGESQPHPAKSAEHGAPNHAAAAPCDRPENIAANSAAERLHQIRQERFHRSFRLRAPICGRWQAA